MPAQSQTAETNLEIDRDAHTIRMARVFDAPRAAIFAAWTEPRQVRLWWDAAGDPLTTCEIDLRPGGAFKFVAKGHSEMPFAGVYREISPPDRLVFEAMGATGRVMLHEIAGETHMVVEIACQSAEQLDQYLKMGVHTGTSQTLDNLVAYARGRSISVDEPV
jgi:uncharacterized protein YndB with AHSA1/START domain